MKQYQFKNLIFILPVLLLVFAYSYFAIDKATKVTYSSAEKNVLINNVPISVMVADEPSEQWQGLSDRSSMGAYNGMLFAFSDYQLRTFVMRNMEYPLDIIWIKDNKVVKIDKRLEPEGSNPQKRYSSPEAVNYVLEVNGGFSDAFGLKVGNDVIMNYE